MFEIYKAFCAPDQLADFAKAYADGIGWGDAKQQLFELLNAQLSEPRERYNEFMATPDAVETILQEGAKKARTLSAPYLSKLRNAVGIS